MCSGWCSCEACCLPWSVTLYLSEGTVRNYVSAVLAKLNVSDRTQAALLALRHGLGAGDRR
jgi:hypothetical protein